VDTERLIGEKITKEDDNSSAITSAIRSVVASVNKQLTTVVPDGAALARAGSSLSGQVLAGVPASGVKAPAPPKTPAAQMPAPRGLQPGQDDDLLQKYIENLQADINDASTVIAADVTFAAISCKVADAPAIAAITIVLPPDSAGKASTEFTYKTGQTLSYPINGGSSPYMGVQWVGETPKCFTVVINSPNTLVVSPVSAVSCSSGQKFSFDIYDSAGQHLAKTITITTP